MDASPRSTAESIETVSAVDAVAIANMESKSSSSSLIWCKMDILPSSSEMSWDLWRQPSHPGEEVSEGMDRSGVEGSGGRETQLRPVKRSSDMACSSDTVSNSKAELK